MTTIINSLYDNLFDLDKSKILPQDANYIKSDKDTNDCNNQSLNQGYKFTQYQKKILYKGKKKN